MPRFPVTPASFADPAELLAQAQPEITSICTPDETHFELARMALQASSVRAVLCEKPLAMSVEQGEELVLNLGYSHPIKFKPPKGISIDVQDPTKFSVSGISIEDVGQVAANLRSLRPPEPYKGKGVRYAGEHIRRKVGKAGK